MAMDTEALCNSTKDQLHLTLQQPNKYSDDLEAGGKFLDSLGELLDDDDGEGTEGEEAAGEGKTEESEDKSGSTKIPPLYQVEPGCTPLSCYSAILTFIVLTLGVFWLLLTSPPKNSVPVPLPGSATSTFTVSDAPNPFSNSLSTFGPTSEPSHGFIVADSTSN